MSEIKKLTDLRPDDHNANRGNPRGLGMLDSSLRKRGAGRSILLDRNLKIIAGNKTHQAAVDIGLEDVIIVKTNGSQLVAVQREDLDLDDPATGARELAYLDNRTSEVGLDWDASVIVSDLELGLDLSSLWSPDELSVMLEGAADSLLGGDGNSPDPGPQIDRAEELQKKWQVQPGDLYQIDRHFVICGDCRESDTWERLLKAAGIQKVNGVFTSPPYAEQRKAQYGGVPTAEYVEWWEAVQGNVRANLAGDGSFFVNIKPHSEEGERSLYVMDLVIAMSRQWEWSFVDEFCWLRSGVPREVKYSFKNGFEPVYHFAATQKGFRFRPEEVRHESDSVPIPGGPGVGNTNWAGKQGHKPQYGKPASDLQGHSSWIFGGQEYAPGMAYPSNVLKPFSNDETRAHEASFPTQLPTFFIKAYSDPGDSWLDPFLGSGTTIVAAHNEGRTGLGIEQLPKYVSVILERLQAVTARDPIRLSE